MKNSILLILVVMVIAMPAAAEETRLLRNPDISATHAAFVYANDIWIVDREGGEARRLTTFPGSETGPHFSPDGTMVAFSGEYDGNLDVFVVPLEGGEPTRLTWHPGPDFVQGWTNDGQSVVFGSGRTTVPRPQPKLWTVGLEGGIPQPLPIPRVATGKFSPDGTRMAYQVVDPWEVEFRNYRGGQCNPIRIIDLETYEVEKVPWVDSNDLSPVWMGDTVFFLSDRDWAMNVWSFDTASKTVTQRTFFMEFDCKNLEGGNGTLIFENGGTLHTMDAAGGDAVQLAISLRGDFPWARPHWVDAGENLRTSALSPTGKRAVFEARGEIFTVPAEKGDTRNLTHTSGAAERSPSWSPDGSMIAWFSDESGEYQLVIADQYGKDPRTIALENPTFYYTPRWSPDSKHLAFGDADRNLWVAEISSGKVRHIDNENFTHPERMIYPAWSPDSKHIAYSTRLTNQFNAVFLYSVETGESVQFTDGLSNSHSPAWDKGGKYLYFLASTDYGLNVGWLDMTSYNQPNNYAIYLAVLDKDLPSPLAPESDDEEISEEGDKDKKKDEEEDKEDEVPEVKIDLEDIDQRILALDVPARSYTSLAAGEAGVLFITERIPNQPGLTLHRYKLEDREAKQVTTGITGSTLSADGKKVLTRGPDRSWAIIDADGEPASGDGALDLSGLRFKVDPQAEWRQIFKEAWRYQRDYFYVENVHGLDMQWAFDTYSPWLDHVRHRADLTYILDILGGETAVGHSFVRGGDEPDVDRVPVGLLGADYEIADERYRITRIYHGENWNPGLQAPLSGPGIDAREGDYLLAVDGVELTSDMNPFSLFGQTAGRQVVLTLNDKPGMKGAREVTVVPVADETNLRQREWVDGNRR